MIKSDRETEMKKVQIPTGNSRDKLGSTGSIELFTIQANKISDQSLNIDIKIYWIVKIIRELKNETVRRKSK
jgi:hypothetical protein